MGFSNQKQTHSMNDMVGRGDHTTVKTPKLHHDSRANHISSKLAEVLVVPGWIINNTQSNFAVEAKDHTAPRPPIPS